MEGSQGKTNDNAKKGLRISVRFSKGGSQNKSEDSKKQQLVEYRGMDDVYNIIAAGSASGAVLGLSIPAGSYRSRARNMALGSVFGAAIGFPLGWVHQKLVEKTNEGKVSNSAEGVDAEDGEE